MEGSKVSLLLQVEFVNPANGDLAKNKAVLGVDVLTSNQL